MIYHIAGADDCNLETKDCGERKAEPPKVTLWAGMKENLVFQKNLDHFNMKTPVCQAIHNMMQLNSYLSIVLL